MADRLWLFGGKVQLAYYVAGTRALLCPACPCAPCCGNTVLPLSFCLVVEGAAGPGFNGAHLLTYFDPGPGYLPGWFSGPGVVPSNPDFFYAFVCADCADARGRRFCLSLENTHNLTSGGLCSSSLTSFAGAGGTCRPFRWGGSADAFFPFVGPMGWQVSDDYGPCGGSGSGSGVGPGDGGTDHPLGTCCGAIPFPDTSHLTLTGTCACLNGTVVMTRDPATGAVTGTSTSCPGHTVSLQMACMTDPGGGPFDVVALRYSVDGGGPVDGVAANTTCPPGAWHVDGTVTFAGGNGGGACADGETLEWNWTA